MTLRFIRRHARAGLLALAIAAAATPAPVRAQTIRNLQLEAHLDEYPPSPAGTGYSSCWSYVHGDGREYAVIGTNSGTAIYNVTVPAATYRVGFIPGPFSPWREMKSYRDWIYIVTEGATAGRGIQIVRMTDPEAPVLAATYTTNFSRSHTVSVDTARAVLVLNGTRDDNGFATGMRILSIADPESPVEIGRWPVLPIGMAVPDSQYVHDSVPMGGRLYASSIYPGIHRVFDFADPANPVQLRQWTYPGAFTHNSWPDASGQWVYVTDERYGEALKVFDISDLGAPVLENRITSNPGGIVHNAHVLGNELYLANYTEGVRVLDVTDPMHPAEFAFHDTYAGASGDFNGVWGVCPYFPSGTVIASDRNSGLYVYRVNRDYGRVRVVVTTETAASGATCCLGPGQGCCCAPNPCRCAKPAHAGHAGHSALPGVQVHLDGVDSLVTASDGAVVFAASPGSHMVMVRAFGYEDALVGVNAVPGAEDTAIVVLVPKPRAPFAGTIRDAVTDAGLEDAEAILSYTPLHDHTDAGGSFDFGPVPVGDYTLELHAPGHAPERVIRDIGMSGATEQDYRLRPAAHWEDLESGAGWVVGSVNDNATGGTWVRVDPLGTGDAPPAAPNSGIRNLRERRGAGPFHEGHGEEGDVLPGSVQPDGDRTPGAGTLCFVTGQGTDPLLTGEADLDGGITTVVSPALDVSGMADPTIGVWRWFYTNTPYDPNDRLSISLSANGGTSWSSSRTISGLQNHWVEETIRVLDYLPPGTTSVRVRFVAADNGNASIVEAAFDDLVAYDAALPAVAAPGAARPAAFALRPPRPNPSRGEVSFALDLPRAGTLAVDVLDVTGRRVASLHDGDSAAGVRVLTWDGRGGAGEPAGAGLYFVRARFEGETRTVRVVRAR